MTYDHWKATNPADEYLGNRRPCPAPEYELAPCPKCGARTEGEAETACKPRPDVTDEYVCPGEFNSDGWSVRTTAASQKAIDDWCEASV